MSVRLRRVTSGVDAAYGPRNKRETRIRHGAWRALNVLGRRPRAHPVDFLEFHPAVRDASEFADLSARVTCYLAGSRLPLYLPGPRFPLNERLAPYMDPRLVRDPGWIHERPGGRSYLIVHRLTPGSLAQVLSHGGAGASVVDHRLYRTSETDYWSVRSRVAWPNYPSADTSLERLRSVAPNGRTAFVLATGPSSTTVELANIEADVRITCNSAVHDVDRLTDFRPNIIAFADPVFHYGPSRYAAAFRDDLLRAIDICDPLLLCPTDWVSPLIDLMPDLKSRIAAVPFREGGAWRWPTDQNPTTRIAGSVFTNLMLPIALMLADDVLVAGVDGRQPTEKYFWSHGIQYSDDLMRTVFDAHPAFFRDVDYVDYYDRYCRDVEGLITMAESHGKRVTPAAPSWIPAMHRRGAPAPAGS